MVSFGPNFVRHMNKYLFILCFMSVFGFSDSRTSSISDLQVLEKELDALDGEVLVLFDIDRTLIVPDDAILRPPADNQLDILLGGSKVKSDGGAHKYLFREILLKAPHSLVDKGSVEMIQRLQAKGIPVIAFTAAPSGKVGDVDSVIDSRIVEMRQFGFDFSPAFSSVGTLEFTRDPSKEFPPTFKEGILCSSLHSKGATLKQFLKVTGYRPDYVILIDDQKEYVLSVGSAAEDLGIHYIGYHYTAAEDLPCELDPEVAAFQLRHFLENDEWKSDAEAKILLQGKPVAIYFDFGGVMAQPDREVQLDYLVEKGFPKDAIQDSPYFRWMQLHLAEIEYLSKKALENHISFTPTVIEEYRLIKRSSVGEMPGMSDLVRTLRQMKYEVNLITNIRPENLILIQPFTSLFDRVVHCPKDPGERQEAWEMELAHHGQSLMLIDDQELNVKEAEKLGIQAIHFQDVEKLIHELTHRSILK
jgi:FMN phosphatase YigB (HAD superfamily)